MGISRAEALDCLRSDDLIGLGMEADAVRRRLHPEEVATYAVVAALDCAAAGVLEAASLVVDEGVSGLLLEDAAGMGAAGVLGLIAELRRRFPEVWLAGLTASEAGHLTADAAVGGDELMRRLREAGMNSLSAEGPVPGDRDAVGAWVEAHRLAHAVGLRTVATMQFGVGETVNDRLDFLETVRGVQEDTGGFVAFVPQSIGGGLHGPTAVECLKTLAVSRLMLEGVEHLGAGLMESGLKVLEVGLRFGANDAGEVRFAASVGVAAGYGAGSGYEEDLRRVIRDAGLLPAQRDAGFSRLFLG